MFSVHRYRVATGQGKKNLVSEAYFYREALIPGSGYITTIFSNMQKVRHDAYQWSERASHADMMAISK